MSYTVYGKPSCPYCTKAIELLEAHGMEYEYIDVAEDAEALRYLKEDLKARTVPQIFDGPTYVGGYDHLKIHLV